MRILGMLALVVACLIGPASAPAAAAGELQLSPDGVHWAGALPAPIFDPAMRWVPGDAETGTFYVRNVSRDPGTLGITMLGSKVTGLIDSGDVSVALRIGNRSWSVVDIAGPHDLVRNQVVPPRGTRQVQVRVTYDPASPNATQDQRFDLAFRVTLEQRSAVAGPGGVQGDDDGQGGGSGVNGPGHGADGQLPSTGADFSPLTLLLAVLLCSIGGLFALAGGRRRRYDTRPATERQS